MPSGDEPTLEAVPTTPPRPRAVAAGARFLPGTVLGGRYRIVAPLGSGGMGEVWRADDLKLGQPVALKFLSREVERDPGRLALLLDEVRTARQVSHPHVCRVWDVGEADGLHFIAMEYVDGESLDSLLRRIGRLPEDRAVRLARELCAGLEAVHDQGLLHRDLKPANVMIDGRGRVRLTDFGLAVLEGAVAEGELGHGTPAYMAPEQRAGRAVSVRSDVYALGLVLHEVFTGRSASESGGRASTQLGGVDPVIEQAVLRCLEPDPSARPSSALAVARALPGGDPLGVALAHGETPSPEMVAAAGGVGGLRPLVAWALVALSLAGAVSLLALSERRTHPFAAGARPYAALRDRAEEFAHSVGGPESGGDAVDGYSRMPGGSVGVARAQGAIFYWHRRSPRAIVLRGDDDRDVSGFVLPALEAPGEIAQRYDPSGLLLEFRRQPMATSSASSPPDHAASTSALEPYFAAAGLSDSGLVPTAVPAAPPPVPTDSRAAWTAVVGGRSVVVEAAAYGPEVTYFRVGEAYAPPPFTVADVGANTLYTLVFLGMAAGAAFLARRNLRAGRADVRGALRLGMVGWIAGLLGFGVFANPQFGFRGGYALTGVAFSTLFAVLHALLYLALEPQVRRRHPEWLASWTRLLDGRARDPLVGRDVLFGAFGGIVLALISASNMWFGPLLESGDYQAAAVGGWTALAVVLRGLGQAFLLAFVPVLVLVLLQNVTRRERLGWLLWLLVVTFLFAPATSVAGVAINLVRAAAIGVLLVRAGLLGMFVASAVYATWNAEYLTTNPGAWYGGVTVAVLLALLVFVLWGATAATRGGRATA